MKPNSFPATDVHYARLPKYVQYYIESCVRENIEQKEKIRRLTDNQTPTNIWVEDYGRTDDYREYVQGEKLTVRHAGVWLRVSTVREGSIELQWTGGRSAYSMGEVALIPSSFQSVRLTTPSNMSER